MPFCVVQSEPFILPGSNRTASTWKRCGQLFCSHWKWIAWVFMPMRFGSGKHTAFCKWLLIDTHNRSHEHGAQVAYTYLLFKSPLFCSPAKQKKKPCRVQITLPRALLWVRTLLSTCLYMTMPLMSLRGPNTAYCRRAHMLLTSEVVEEWKGRQAMLVGKWHLICTTGYL